MAKTNKPVKLIKQAFKHICNSCAYKLFPEDMTRYFDAYINVVDWHVEKGKKIPTLKEWSTDRLNDGNISKAFYERLFK